MKAIVYEGPDKITVKNVPQPKVGQKDLLIKVRAAGICGSDLNGPWQPR
jgi:threonine dehydrogenase-like Zn-dependent dehydrogenase